MTKPIKRIDGGWSGRYYETPEGKYPSVTTILGVIGKPALINWAANREREMCLEAAADLYEDAPLKPGIPKMGRLVYMNTLADRIGRVKAYQNEKAAAADIGTEAHKLVEHFLREELGQKSVRPKAGIAATWSLQAFQAWWKQADLEAVMMEQMLYSTTHGYAGTMDLLAKCRDTGKLCVVDLKTSARVYPEAHVQIAAYAHALNEMGHGPVERGMVVRLPKKEQDSAFEVVEVADLYEQFTAFLNAFELWKWKEKMERAA